MRKIGKKFIKKNKYVKKQHYAAFKRIPLALLIDVSSSMKGTRSLINKCIKELVKELKNNPNTKATVDLLLILFNQGTIVKIGYESLENIDVEKLMISEEDIHGYTDIGKAIFTAVEKLTTQKEVYKDKVIDYYQPMLFMITDGSVSAYVGAPESLQGELEKKYEKAVDQVKDMVKGKKLSVAVAAIQRSKGASADVKSLKKLTPYVLSVSEKGKSGMETIEDFFDVIEKTATQNTPIDEVIDEYLGRKKQGA